jgi:beta-galactosidase
MTKKTILLTLALLTGLIASARERVNFDKGWRFILGDKAEMAQPQYNDKDWRVLDLPHDWAREGDFSAGHPSGAGGGALPGGIGWYRKTFDVKGKKEDKYFLEFDGVYMNSTVYVNGKEVGHRPYGYSSFEYDITPYVKEGENVVAVRVDNSDQPNSRWYSGCGIYRHVWLTKTNTVHVKHWGVFANASVVKGKGKLHIEVDVEGQGTVENTLFAPDGSPVGKSKGAKSTITVSKPMLWSIETPNIYKVRTEVKVGGKVVDTYETTTGFRDFKFDAKTGFWLNGKNFKLNGVCEHHDFGSLGAALYEDALHRKLTKLKAMGVNAIRSSHNPPAPELLNMCDTMGLIVMDESFDMWRRRKTAGDYARFFDEWHERDMTDLILRDRNHPCILMWSIGNEVLEQWSSAEADTLTLEQANLILNAGHDASTLAKDGELSVQSLLTQHLAEIVKRYDTSRPITAGCNEPSPGNHLFKSGAIDLIGFNYHPQWTKDVPVNFPNKPFVFTESCSALQTRGNYMMPSDSIYKAPVEWYLPYYDASFMCSAYDNMKASWGNTHEEMWDAVKHTPFCGGQFIWTGFDYIGEPTPYGFPARSSYFGLIDLAGFPKDSYYMYQSEWTSKPMLYLFPHWNWLEGQTIDLWAYYNQADEVELFINGKSQGIRKKIPTNSSHDGSGILALNTEYHVGWRVTFEPGEVKAVSRKDGKTVCEQIIRTAGAPHHIRLTTDYAGKDLTFVNAEVVDKDGNLCPWSEDQIFFSVSGGAEIISTDNGCQTSMERFTSPNRKAFFGKCIAVVRGKGVLTARGIGLENGHINIK